MVSSVVEEDLTSGPIYIQGEADEKSYSKAPWMGLLLPTWVGGPQMHSGACPNNDRLT